MPDLFKSNVGRFYLQMASEPNKERVLHLVSQLTNPQHRVFIGVIDPVNSVIETAAQVRDRILKAAASWRRSNLEPPTTVVSRRSPMMPQLLGIQHSRKFAQELKELNSQVESWISEWSIGE